jgi:hypothetical protein
LEKRRPLHASPMQESRSSILNLSDTVL